MSRGAYLATLLAGFLIMAGLALDSVARGSTPLSSRTVLSSLAGRHAEALNLPAGSVSRKSASRNVVTSVRQAA